MKLNIQRFAAATVVFAPLNSATDITTQSPTITLTFSDAVTKTGGTAIADADLASMLSFKLEDADGASVPCSMSINAGKTVVTIVPTSDLIAEQDYYVAVLAEKFYVSSDATVATAATWTTDAAVTHTGTAVGVNDIVDKAPVACGLSDNFYTFQAGDEKTMIVAINTSADAAYDIRVNAPSNPNYAGKDVADIVEELAFGNVAVINIESAKYADLTGKINIKAEHADVKLAVFYRS